MVQFNSNQSPPPQQQIITNNGRAASTYGDSIASQVANNNYDQQAIPQYTEMPPPSQI